MRHWFVALLLCLALPVQAEGFITRLLNKPVPGGVAVVDLGHGPAAPQVRYQGKPALVIHEDDGFRKSLIATLDHPAIKNRIVNEALQSTLTSNPSPSTRFTAKRPASSCGSTHSMAR